MTSSQDLVPTGQPQGRRQETVDAMQAAGVPLSSQDVSGGGSLPAAPAPVSPTPGATPATPPPPGDFDVFSEREPTEGFSQIPQREVMFEQVRQSDNAILKAVFSRMQGYKEG